MDFLTKRRPQNKDILKSTGDSILVDSTKAGIIAPKVDPDAQSVVTNDEFEIDDEFEIELDEMKKEREIPYPVLKVKIGLRVDRPLTCFINVKTCADNVTTVIDHTETIDYAGNGDDFFKKEIEVMYFVGIDDRQVLTFEIHDGDKYHHRSGYLWASVSIPVSLILRNQEHLPIYRGDDVLGYLLFGVNIIEKQKLVSLMDEDALGLRFFKSTRPTREDILTFCDKTIGDVVPQYKLTVTTSKIVPKFREKSKDDAFCTILRLCITDQLNGPLSKKATVLWQSNPNYKSPYDFIGMDITINEAKIVKLQGTNLKKSKSFGESRLVWQVCTRDKNTIDDNDFELLSYSTIKYSTFRKCAKEAKVWNEAHEEYKKDHKGMMQLDPSFLLSQDNMPKQIKKFFYSKDVVRERDNFGKISKKDQDKHGFGGITDMSNLLTDINSKLNDAMNLENIQNQISHLSTDISAGAMDQMNKFNHLSADAFNQLNHLDLTGVDMQHMNEVMNKNMNDMMHGKINLDFFKKEDSYDSFEDELKGVCAAVNVDEETGIDVKMSVKNNSVITIDDIAFDSDEEDIDKPIYGEIQFSPLLEIQKIAIGPGEDTFDRIVDAQLKQRIDDWLIAVRPIFREALLEQRRTVLKSINILNGIKSGVRINPSFVIDMNPLCTMSLMQQSAINSNAGTVKIESNVLKAVDVVYNFLYSFSNTNRIQAFAGGEVTPPMQNQHPLYSCCRRVGIPLCQEFLVNAEREGLLRIAYQKQRDSKGGALPHEDAPKCASIFSMNSRNAIYDYLDKNQDLRSRMRIPVENPESWGGVEYSSTHNVDRYEAFLTGIEEASMLYQPIIRKSDPSTESGLMAFTGSDRVAAANVIGADLHDNASDELQRKIVKQNIDICFTGSSNVPTGDEFWGILKNHDLISSADYCSYDLDTIEVLLASAQRTADREDIPVVIWIISQPPSEEMVKRAKNLFYRQCIGDFDSTKLIVLLVAEVRYDVFNYTQSDLVSIGDQFEGLKNAYKEADSDAIMHLRNTMHDGKKVSRKNREEERSHFEKIADLHKEGRDNAYKRIKGNLHVVTNHYMMLFHWISWPEVVAKAIIKEKTAFSATNDKSGHHGHHQGHHQGHRDGDSNKESLAGMSRFPKLESFQNVLEDFFPTSTARRIIDIDEFELAVDNSSQNIDTRSHHDSASTYKGSTKRASGNGFRTSIAGFFGDGVGRRFSNGMLHMLSVKGSSGVTVESPSGKGKEKEKKAKKEQSSGRYSEFSSQRRKKLMKKINGFSHLMQLKNRFEKEKSMLVINHLRVFLSDAIDAVKKDEEIHSNAEAKFWGVLSPLVCSAQSSAHGDAGCIVS